MQPGHAKGAPGAAARPRGARHLYDPRVSDVSVTLAGDSSSVPAARRFVVAMLESWDLPDAVWAAQQIIAELAANCALHARTEYSVRLARTEDAVRLEVTDASPASVRPRRYSNEATTGRGLRLVADLSESWGVDRTAGGKTVWVLLRLTPYLVEDDGEGLVDDDLDTLLDAFGEDSDSVTALAA